VTPVQLVAVVMLSGVALPGIAITRTTSAALTQRPATTAPAGDAEKGKALYNSYGCYQCHGYEGQGSSATGPRLAPRPLPFAAFSSYVRRPAGQMPLYTEKLVSDADLANIYAFLQARPAAPPVESIPLLR